MKRLLALGCMVLITGCTTTDAVKTNIASPCTLPDTGADTGPAKYTHHVPSVIKPAPIDVSIPKQAASAKINGCVSVEYRIDAHGKPYSVKALIEEPKGYGFAQTAIAMMRKTRFEKPEKAGSYYLTINSWRLAE
jgi:TonB family protein